MKVLVLLMTSMTAMTVAMPIVISPIPMAARDIDAGNLLERDAAPKSPGSQGTGWKRDAAPKSPGSQGTGWKRDADPKSPGSQGTGWRRAPKSPGSQGTGW